jgi:basic membrane protein A
VPGATITKFEVGYIEGIKSIIPDAKIVDYYANDWGKPELAKAQAKNWYDSGVYAIYSAAGGTGNGTIAQAKEYRSQGKNVWAIGVDSDQYEEGIYADGKSAVLTSMLKRVETATSNGLKAVADKTFAAGVVTLDMKSDGIGFSDKNAELGADIVAKINAVKQDIIDRKVTVHATYKDALDAKTVPEGLGAKDN